MSKTTSPQKLIDYDCVTLYLLPLLVKSGLEYSLDLLVEVLDPRGVLQSGHFMTNHTTKFEEKKYFFNFSTGIANNHEKKITLKKNENSFEIIITNTVKQKCDLFFKRLL